MKVRHCNPSNCKISQQPLTVIGSSQISISIPFDPWPSACILHCLSLSCIPIIDAPQTRWSSNRSLPSPPHRLMYREIITLEDAFFSASSTVIYILNILVRQTLNPRTYKSLFLKHSQPPEPYKKLSQISMTTSLPHIASTADLAQVARSLHWSARLTYGLASRCRGHFVLEHDAQFGVFNECPLGNEDALKALLSSVYGNHNLWAFRSAFEALVSFNTAFMRLESLSGLDTAATQLGGYFLRGPTDLLLRLLREAVSTNIDRGQDVQQLIAAIAENADRLKAILEVESDAERATLRAEAVRLVQGPPTSLEEVAAEMSITSQRRDMRAVAFVALALAGWEPDLDGWDKNVANIIRGERPFRGQYHLSVPLTRTIQRDIIVGLSLERRDVAMTLDGTTLQRIQTFHVNQDEVARYVRAANLPNEKMVATVWAPFERTPVLDWETVKEFISQTGPIRYEWTSHINRIKEIGKVGALMGGLETGEVFLNMSSNIKASAPHIYKIWEKTISQMSFTALTCVATTTAAARAAVIERMVVSTVTDGSCYHISSHPIYLRVEDGTARLFESGGNMVFVDGVLESLADREAADVGVKFFALLTRAMDGGIIKPGFYQDSARHASVLRARGPRRGFDRRDDSERENTSARTWQELCESPFAPVRVNTNKNNSNNS